MKRDATFERQRTGYLTAITRADVNKMTDTRYSESYCHGQVPYLLHVTMDAGLPGHFSVGRSSYNCNRAPGSGSDVCQRLGTTIMHCSRNKFAPIRSSGVTAMPHSCPASANRSEGTRTSRKSSSGYQRTGSHENSHRIDSRDGSSQSAACNRAHSNRRRPRDHLLDRDQTARPGRKQRSKIPPATPGCGFRPE